MKVETWCEYNIRFVEKDGEWWAILKDICDALELRTDKVASRLDPNTLTRVKVETSNNPLRVVRSKGDNKYRQMLAVNELGIYEALFASRRPEANKFRAWTATVVQKLRKSVGLEQYEAMRITEPEIQDDIDHILDTLFYDEDTGMVMKSVTIQGGDVEQVPFDVDQLIYVCKQRIELAEERIANNER